MFLNGMAPEGAFLPEKCPKITESMVGQLALSRITASAQAVATLIEWNGARWRLFARMAPRWKLFAGNAPGKFLTLSSSQFLN